MPSRKTRLFTLTFILLSVGTMLAQTATWYSQPHLNNVYNLSGKKILIVVAPRFNPGETIDMAECWKRWGAQVEFAGPERVLTGAGDEVRPGADKLQMTHLLTEVDPSRYDAVYFAGGEGVPPLLANHREQLARIIDSAVRRGKPVSGMCHGPMLMAASATIKGRRVTVQGTMPARTLAEAGATVVNEITVSDGEFISAQWPNFETFAVVLAERMQYPGGGGPYEKAQASRNPMEKAVDDVRTSPVFEPRPVPSDVLEKLVRAAQRATRPNIGPGTGHDAGLGLGQIKFVAVTEQSTRTKIAEMFLARSKDWAVGSGVSEAALRRYFSTGIQQAPVLLFQFVDAPPSPENARIQRVNMAHAGASSANMMLVARSLGLGMGVLGAPVMELESELKDLLQVPESAQLAGVFPVGYPATSSIPRTVLPPSNVFFNERWKAELRP